MHAHNHTVCDHEVKLCKECDLVYCEKCSEEWGKKIQIRQRRLPELPPNYFEERPNIQATAESPHNHG